MKRLVVGFVFLIATLARNTHIFQQKTTESNKIINCLNGVIIANSLILIVAHGVKNKPLGSHLFFIWYNK